MKIIKLNFPYEQTRHWIPLVINNVNKIIVHEIEKETAEPEEINRWHLTENKWEGGFGYGEYIRKNGTVCIGRDMNMGSHCQGHNANSYGIACEGNYDIEKTMPTAQKQALVERIIYNMVRFPKVTNILPHNYFNKFKTCPGIYFPMSEILKMVEQNKSNEDKNYKSNVDLVAGILKLTSPEYWYNHQDKFVKILITKMAEKLRSLH
ncbi:MAG: hypothetical protein RLZZ577_49 [Bacteroidota bacterium]|jgi:hypothetical protein